ncbi:MAG: hypothetical protein Q9M25_02020, partial [Mariprofundaceae bacterium]|nr:hypothetical protein [Mariprofundaceae bacterium]
MPDDDKKTTTAAKTAPEAIAEATADEQVADGQSTDKPSAGNNQSVAPKRKRRLGPWLFLLLIFFGLPLAWFFSPPQIQRQADDVLTRFIAQIT